jgi:hypothetical protein
MMASRQQAPPPSQTFGGEMQQQAPPPAMMAPQQQAPPPAMMAPPQGVTITPIAPTIGLQLVESAFPAVNNIPQISSQKKLFPDDIRPYIALKNPVQEKSINQSSLATYDSMASMIIQRRIISSQDDLNKIFPRTLAGVLKEDLIDELFAEIKKSPNTWSYLDTTNFIDLRKEISQEIYTPEFYTEGYSPSYFCGDYHGDLVEKARISVEGGIVQTKRGNTNETFPTAKLVANYGTISRPITGNIVISTPLLRFPNGITISSTQNTDGHRYKARIIPNYDDSDPHQASFMKLLNTIYESCVDYAYANRVQFGKSDMNIQKPEGSFRRVVTDQLNRQTSLPMPGKPKISFFDLLCYINGTDRRLAEFCNCEGKNYSWADLAKFGFTARFSLHILRIQQINGFQMVNRVYKVYIQELLPKGKNVSDDEVRHLVQMSSPDSANKIDTILSETPTTATEEDLFNMARQRTEAKNKQENSDKTSQIGANIAPISNPGAFSSQAPLRS